MVESTTSSKEKENPKETLSIVSSVVGLVTTLVNSVFTVINDGLVKKKQAGKKKDPQMDTVRRNRLSDTYQQLL